MDAFNRIEKHLRSATGARPDETFSELLSECAQNNTIVKRYYADLREYAHLRNAIVHNVSRQGKVIADPRADAVMHIEQIRDRILEPPKVGSAFRCDVKTAEQKELVGVAARRMLDGNFSQLPVYSGGKFVALLTSETVARWLGSKFAAGEELLCLEDSVGEVLPHAEASSRCEFLGQNKSVVEAIDLFHKHSVENGALDAIILTNDGKRDSPPLGILTTYDIPALYKLVAIEKS